jgi:hypothetical protein
MFFPAPVSKLGGPEAAYQTVFLPPKNRVSLHLCKRLHFLLRARATSIFASQMLHFKSDLV